MKPASKKKSDFHHITHKMIALLCVLFFVLPSVQAISQGTDSKSNQDLTSSTHNGFWIQVIGRGAIQNEVAFPYLIRYGNNGTTDIPAPLIAISAIPASSDIFVKIGDLNWKTFNDMIIVSSKGSPDNPGKLEPGSSYSIPLQIKVYNNTQFSIIANPLSKTSLYAPQVIESSIDAKCPSIGIPFEFSRSYPGGYSAYDGPMGYGWIHSFDVHIEKMGDGNIALKQGSSYLGIFLNNSDGFFISQDRENLITTNPDKTFVLNEKNGNAFGFTSDGLLSSLKDINGNSISLNYDNQKNLIRVQHSSGDIFKFEYTGSGKLSRFIDHAGRPTAYSYDPTGQLLTSVVTPDGGITQYNYTSQMGGYALSSVIYPDNTRYDFTLDVNGYPEEQSQSSGKNKIRYTYDTDAKTTQITDDRGNAGKITLNNLGQMVSTQSADGEKTRYVYDSNGKVSTFTDPLGRMSRFVYDTEGNIIATTDPSGKQITLGYVPSSNNVAWIQDSLGRKTTYSYDQQDNLVEIRYPDNYADSSVYNSENLLIQTSDPSGKTTKYSWNKRGQITSIQDARGYTSTFSYDNAGNLNKIVDFRGKIITNEYDIADRLLLSRYPDGSTEQYNYDKIGNLISYVNRAGEKISYTHDNDGQLVEITYPSGKKVRYSYSKQGDLESIETTENNNLITTGYGRNPSGEVTCTTVQGLTAQKPLSIAYTYNLKGNPTGLNYPDGYAVQYRYDVDNRLTEIVDSTQHTVVSYKYDSIGRIIQRTLGNGVYTTYNYDIRDRITELVNHAADGKVIAEYSYSYNPAGIVTAMKSSDGEYRYSYDNDYQLTRVEYPDRSVVEYQYDEAGNRISVKDQNGKTDYQSNNLDQYTKAGSESFTYDKKGNIVDRLSNNLRSHYTWDEDNRLIGVSRDNITITYQYDDSGRLVTKKTGETVIHYLWDGENIIAETDGNGNVLKRYIYGNEADELVLAYQNNQNVWILQDRIGSITDTFNDQGIVAGQGSYDVYGVPRGSITTGISQGFVGMRWDEDARLYYVRNRWYDPTLGRFINPDYIQSSLKNQYNYGENSPLHFKDTDGLASQYVETRNKAIEHTFKWAGAFSKVHIKDYLDYHKIQFVGPKGQDAWNFDAIPKNNVYTGYKTAFSRVGTFTYGVDVFTYLQDIDRRNNHEMTNRDFGLQSAKMGMSTVAIVAGGSTAAWATSISPVWTSAQAGWHIGKFLGEQSISTDLSMTYNQFYQQQFTQFYENRDNKNNQYGTQQFNNYQIWAANSGIPKNQIMSRETFNGDAALRQMSPKAIVPYKTPPPGTPWRTPQQALSPQIQNYYPSAGRIPEDHIIRGVSTDKKPFSFYGTPSNDGWITIRPNAPGGVDFSNIQLNSLLLSDDSDAQVFSYTMKTTLVQPGENADDIENATGLSFRAFITGLTMPNSVLWVNLNPREPDRIIDKNLAKTDVGRIMLEADLDMKKDYARFENGCVYPVGAEYEALILQKEQDLLNNLKSKYPTESVKIDKIQFKNSLSHWIGPDRIDVRLNKDQIFIDTLSLTITRNPTDERAGYNSPDDLSLSNALKEDLDAAAKEYLRYAADKEELMITPLVIKETNTAQKYSDLRRVFSSLALAHWYKEKYRGTNAIFADKIDTGDVTGLSTRISWNYEDTYKAYLKSYNEKEFKCRVDLPMITMSNGTTFQRYNTYGVGGVVFSKIPFTQVSEITPEIDQIMKEAIFQESLSSPESDKITITSTSKDKIVYIGDSIFSVKKSPIQTKLPKIYTKNTRKPLIPTQWLTTILVISGIAIVGIAILMKRKKHEDYEEDNY